MNRHGKVTSRSRKKRSKSSNIFTSCHFSMSLYRRRKKAEVKGWDFKGETIQLTDDAVFKKLFTNLI